MFIKKKTTSSAKRSSPNKRSNMSGKGLFDASTLEAKTQGSLSTNISKSTKGTAASMSIKRKKNGSSAAGAKQRMSQDN